MSAFNELLEHVGKDTFRCWEATRINGSSASLACDGNISIPLLRLLDEKIKPILKSKEDKK